MKTILNIFLFTVLIVLAACGGGGSSSSSSAPVTNSPAQGLWVGTTSSNSTINLLVLGDGSYYMTHSPDNDPTSIDGFIQGTGTATASPGTFTSSDLKDFLFGNSTPVSATLTASYSAKQSFNGTITAGSTTATFTTTYNTSYDTTPALATIAGTYTGTAVIISVGNGPSTVTISPTGAVSDDGGNCQITGSVSPRSEGNAYNFSATYPAGCPTAAVANKTFSGIASFNATNKQIYVAAPNAARTDGVFYVGAKP